MERKIDTRKDRHKKKLIIVKKKLETVIKSNQRKVTTALYVVEKMQREKENGKWV